MPTYSLLACKTPCLPVYNTSLHRRQNCSVMNYFQPPQVTSSWPNTASSHPLIFHQLYLVNFKFMTYLVGWFSSIQCHPNYPLPPTITKQTIQQLPSDLIWSISSCISTFPGVSGGGWMGGNNHT